jgi:RNA polymerase sigma-70 factor (ECF subfamily)
LRYARRLRALAARRTGGDFAGRFDADDIVQSVFRAFFQEARRRAYDVPPGGEIWGLLLVLALNKIRNKVEHHRAAKRDAHQTAADPDLVGQQALSRDEHAAVFLRLVLDEQLAELPESNRAIVRMRMEGYELGEIAGRAGRSRRTVERVLRDFRDRLAGP